MDRSLRINPRKTTPGTLPSAVERRTQAKREDLADKYRKEWRAKTAAREDVGTCEMDEYVEYKTAEEIAHEQKDMPIKNLIAQFANIDLGILRGGGIRQVGGMGRELLILFFLITNQDPVLFFKRVPGLAMKFLQLLSQLTECFWYLYNETALRAYQGIIGWLAETIEDPKNLIADYKKTASATASATVATANATVKALIYLEDCMMQLADTINTDRTGMGALQDHLASLQEDLNKQKAARLAELGETITAQTKQKMAKQEQIAKLEATREHTGIVTDLERTYQDDIDNLDHVIFELTADIGKLNAVRAAGAAGVTGKYRGKKSGKGKGKVPSNFQHPSPAAVSAVLNRGIGPMEEDDDPMAGGKRKTKKRSNKKKKTKKHKKKQHRKTKRG